MTIPAPEERKGISIDRRSFLKDAAAASLTGVAVLSATEARAQQPSADSDPPKPAGLKPMAEFDSRFPVAYNSSVPESMRILTQYFQALSERNLDGVADTLHYPFVTYEGSEPVVVESADQLRANPPQSMNVTAKGDLITPGSYDIMEGIELHLYNPCGAGFSLPYTRYRADGHKMLGCHGIYGVTNNDGKWGIEFMSTIFQPADQLSETYDALSLVTAQHDHWRLHAEARLKGDLDEARTSINFPGKRASVTIGGSNRSSIPAREGRPMEPYQIKGVKSRLRVSELTQEQIDHPSPEAMAAAAKNQKEFEQYSGGGVGKWAYSIEIPETYVMHAANDKGHIYTGFRRYVANGTMISEARFISAAVFRKGVWNASEITGVFGYMMYQDHTNDVT
ncbi:MAG TPA: twin-arginine translocation signal domain-containing protein [Acidobacteriaceae bacterium]|jgi:hypothetical protein|nr:twin-arginine translocation signal domain-containing protein [Acidobacteriaceae bacterium]